MIELAEDQELASVSLANEQTEVPPLYRDENLAFLVEVVPSRAHLLKTADSDGNRVMVGAKSVQEAVGKVLMANPKLCYGDILAHTEI